MEFLQIRGQLLLFNVLKLRYSSGKEARTSQQLRQPTTGQSNLLRTQRFQMVGGSNALAHLLKMTLVER